MAVSWLRETRCDSLRSSDSEGTDDQMHQRPGPAVENSAAMENTARAASAHPDGVAARERNDAASDCRGNGRVAEHGEPGAHGLRPGRTRGAQAETNRWTQAREHDVGGRKGLAGAF